MARAALKLTVREIEQATGVNKDTVSRYEAGRDILASALQKLEKLFLDAGIIFLDEDASGGVGIGCRTKEVPVGHSNPCRKSENWKTKPKSQEFNGPPDAIGTTWAIEGLRTATHIPPRPNTLAGRRSSYERGGATGLNFKHVGQFDYPNCIVTHGEADRFRGAKRVLPCRK